MTEIETCESTRKALEGFDALWERVSGKTARTVFDEDDALRDFIKREQCAAAFDSSLSRMFPQAGRSALLGRASGAKLRARRLRAEYFIRSGISYTPADCCQPVAGKLASLRTAMERDAALALAYNAAAEKTAMPELRKLYQDFARETENAARETRALIVDCF